MTAHRARPKRQAAQAHILSLLRRGGERLPSVVDMAREAGVSHVTMLRAVRELRDGGLLSSSPGVGTRAATQTPKAVLPMAGEPSHALELGVAGAANRIALLVQKDIITGVYPQGKRLPSQKELCRRYGADRRTVLHALFRLTEVHLIDPCGRQFRVQRVLRENARIVLVCGAHDMQHQPWGSNRTEEFMRLLSQRCAQSGLELDIIRILPWGGGVFAPQDRPRLASGTDSRSVDLGYIVCTERLHKWENTPVLLSELVSLGKPVFCFTEEGTITFPKGMYEGQVRVLSVGYDTESGEAVGLALLTRRHLHALFLTVNPLDSWSLARQAGLQKAYNAAEGRLESISMHSKDDSDLPDEVVFAMRPEVNRLLREARQANSAFQPRLAPILERMRLNYYQAVDAERRETVFPRLFTRALSHADATVWVCANDQLARAALYFLREHHRAVPQDICVVGFDDTLEAAASNLASFNFNVAAVVGEALQHLTGGPRIGTVPQRVYGFLNARSGTLRPVARV